MKWEGRAPNQLTEKQVQSEIGSLGYLEANVLCRGNKVLGVKGLKDVESFCTSLMKVCLDVRECAHMRMRAHAHTHNRKILGTNLFTVALQVLSPFLIVIFIPLFDLVIYRLVSKCGINFT